jgi:two-component system sensor histidine kinase PilS (NtrC family)
MLPVCIEECMLKEEAPDGLIATEIQGRGTKLFDRSHFTQVLWNLVGNALRHSQRTTGSVRIQVSDTPNDSRIELHVIDDGKGVDESLREQIFEPFFTTHSRGTGLGLYIARELCDANGAQLDLRHTASGADFCISGRNIE